MSIHILQECNLEDVADEDDASKSSKDPKKANGPDKGPSLVFKITSKVAYKTVLKGDYLHASRTIMSSFNVSNYWDILDVPFWMTLIHDFIACSS